MISIFSTTAGARAESLLIPYAGQSSVVIAPKGTVIKGHEDLSQHEVGSPAARARTASSPCRPRSSRASDPRFDDYSSLMQAVLSGQLDAVGGGDYGDIYLKKSATAKMFEQKYVLKTFFFGIGVRQGQPQSSAVDQHLALLAEDRRRPRRSVDEVSQPAASGAAGFLSRSDAPGRPRRAAFVP